MGVVSHLRAILLLLLLFSYPNILDISKYLNTSGRLFAEMVASLGVRVPLSVQIQLAKCLESAPEVLS